MQVFSAQLASWSPTSVVHSDGSLGMGWQMPELTVARSLARERPGGYPTVLAIDVPAVL